MIYAIIISHILSKRNKKINTDNKKNNGLTAAAFDFNIDNTGFLYYNKIRTTAIRGSVQIVKRKREDK